MRAALWLPFLLSAAEMLMPVAKAQTSGLAAPMTGDCTADTTGNLVCSRTSGALAVQGNKLKVGQTGRADFPGDNGSSQDPSVTVTNQFTDANVTTSGYSHAYTDNSLWQRSGAACGTAINGFYGCAYASYDTRLLIDGPNNMEHAAGFQSGMSTSSTFTGTLNRYVGFTSVPSFNGGTINSLFHFAANNLSYTNSPLVEAVYGFWVDDLTAGGYNPGDASHAASRWAFYAKSNASYFGGPVQLKLNASGAGNTYAGPQGLSVQNYSTVGTDYALLNIKMGADADDHNLLLGSFSNLSAYPGTASKSFVYSSVGQTSGLDIGAQSNAPVTFDTNNTERMRVLASGGVSIGSQTFNATDPGAGNLAVQGGYSNTGVTPNLNVFESLLAGLNNGDRAQLAFGKAWAANQVGTLAYIHDASNPLVQLGLAGNPANNYLTVDQTGQAAAASLSTRQAGAVGTACTIGGYFTLTVDGVQRKVAYCE
jgi:hypothetical protein